jgi:hypothetical protein
MADAIIRIHPGFSERASGARDWWDRPIRLDTRGRGRFLVSSVTPAVNAVCAFQGRLRQRSVFEASLPASTKRIALFSLGAG